MRILILICLTFFFYFQNISAQPSGLNWIRSLGGTQNEYFSSNAILRNGNVITVGRSESNNGNFSGNNGGFDCVIVCTTPDGIDVWKTVTGGSLDEAVFGCSVDTTTDGNFIVGISSRSSNGIYSGNHGGFTDVFLLKYTPNGNLLWCRAFGGTNSELLGDVKATSDGGCIFLASTTSSNSGNVSGITHGGADKWVVKVDVNGIIQWQKLYGGSGDEPPIGSNDGGITTTSDGGYIFCSTTNSIDGDLTSVLPTGTNMGGADVWYVKLSAVGTILWQKIFGGSDLDDFPKIYSEGSSIYAGFNTRSSDRDLFGNLGLYDVAIFKLSSIGNIIWKKQYGSSSYDGISTITGVQNDKIIASFGCYSIVFAGIPIVNQGGNNIGIIASIDTLDGNIKWLKTVNGSQNDGIASIKIAPNSELFLCGNSSSNDFDIYGNHGLSDGIILNFNASNSIRGLVFRDANNNGIYDFGESKLNFVKLQSKKSGISVSQTISDNGSFNLEVDTGTFSTKTSLPNPVYYTSNPDSFFCTFNGFGLQYLDSLALRPVANIKDLRINIFPAGIARPGFDLDFVLIGSNVGTENIPSGSIKLIKDPRTSYQTYSINPSSVSVDTAIWNFVNLAPFDSLKYFFKVKLATPPTLQGRDFINFITEMSPITNDFYPLDNKLYFRYRVVNAYDPNIKKNSQGDTAEINQIQNSEFIHYVIQFQNTGSADAIDVIVKDTFSGKFDIGSIEQLATSHRVRFDVKGNIATWNFSNIHLPDSSTNEPASHGYISFKIRPIKTLGVGEQILNKAAIYFDFNPPVITLTDTISIVAPIKPTPPVVSPSGNIQTCSNSITLKSNYITGNQWYKNGILIPGETKDTLVVTTSGSYKVTTTQNGVTSLASNEVKINLVQIFKPEIKWDGFKLTASPAFAYYQWYQNGQIVSGTMNNYCYPTEPSGTFVVNAYNNINCISVSDSFLLAPTSLDHLNIGGSKIRYFPNPADKTGHLIFYPPPKRIISIKVHNVVGALVINSVINQQETDIDFTKFSSGIYIVSLSDGVANVNFKICVIH